jgi:hypothetical protein
VTVEEIFSHQPTLPPPWAGKISATAPFLRDHRFRQPPSKDSWRIAPLSKKQQDYRRKRHRLPGDNPGETLTVNQSQRVPGFGIHQASSHRSMVANYHELREKLERPFLGGLYLSNSSIWSKAMNNRQVNWKLPPAILRASTGRTWPSL